MSFWKKKKSNKNILNNVSNKNNSNNILENNIISSSYIYINPFIHNVNVIQITFFYKFYKIQI